MLLFKDLFLTGLRFRSRSSQRRQPTSLGNLFLALLFGFLHSLGQKFSIFCSLLLVFLSALLLQSNMSAFVLQDTGSNKMLNLGRFGPGLLTLFKGFLTTYWRTSSSLERLKSFRILLALLGPNRRGTVVSVSLRIFFSTLFDFIILFYNNQVENTQVGTHNALTNRLALPLSSSPWSITRMPFTQQQAHSAMGQNALLHGKTLFVIPTADPDHITLPSTLHQEHQQLLMWPCATHRTYEACGHHPLL